MDQNKLNNQDNLYGSKEMNISNNLSGFQQVKYLRHFITTKTRWIFNIICFDHNKLNISDNFYGSKQVK